MRTRKQNVTIHSLVASDPSDALWPDAAPPPPLNHAQRRKQERERRRLVKRTTVQPLTMDAVPPGSVLSDQTIAAIKANKLALQTTATLPSAMRSKKGSARRRQAIAKQSRRINRRKR